MRVGGTVMLLAVAVVGAGLGPAGCVQRFGRVDVSEGDVPAGVALPGAAAVVGGFAPARIIVHPLSRIEGTGDARRAVVHVQVLDAYGHDIKWPGAVGIEVGPGGTESSARVQWIDLTGGEVNARLFDTISRCYILRVPAPSGETLNVRVRWLLADDHGHPGELVAQGVLSSSQ